MRFSPFISLLLVVNFCTAQTKISSTVFIPSLDSLTYSCTLFFVKQASADLAQFNYKAKGQILNYLPSPGWNFATNSPILTLSFADLFNAINFKRTTKAQAQRIVLGYETGMNAALIEVAQLHASLSNQLNFYNSSLEVLSLENQRFSIVEKDFQNNTIPPSQFLAAQISYANLLNTLQQKLFDLYRSRSELLIKARKGDWVSLPDELLNNSPNTAVK